MRIPTLCTYNSIEFKQGKGAEVHNRKSMESLVKHIARCKMCQRLASVVVPGEKELRAEIRDLRRVNNRLARTKSLTDNRIVFDDSGLADT